MGDNNCKNKSKNDNQKDYIQVSFPDGEKELLILFTYLLEEYKKKYVFSYDEKGKEYYVFEIVDDKNLKPVQDEKELDKLDEILNEFLENHHECSCGCEGDHCDCGECDCDNDHGDCECNHEHHDDCSCGHKHNK